MQQMGELVSMLTFRMLSVAALTSCVLIPLYQNMPPVKWVWYFEMKLMTGSVGFRPWDPWNNYIQRDTVPSSVVTYTGSKLFSIPLVILDSSYWSQLS